LTCAARPIPIFAAPFALHRAQIYADMTLDEFARSPEVFDEAPAR
jgi:hypothetical protein